MKHRGRFLSYLAVLAVVGGCATMPSGPSVMVLPAPGKPFDQFQLEERSCRQWAAQQIGMTPEETHTKNTAAGAAVGTVIGAGLGAAIGAASGNPGTGAAIGAGSGLLVGTAAGSESGRVSGMEAQRRYDNAYIQCMYANGNQVPGTVRMYRRRPSAPPPPSSYEYEPPDASPSYPPPPPPRQ